MGGAFVGGGTGSMLKLKGLETPILLQYDRYKAYSNSSSLKIILIYSLVIIDTAEDEEEEEEEKKYI